MRCTKNDKFLVYGGGANRELEYNPFPPLGPHVGSVSIVAIDQNECESEGFFTTGMEGKIG